jgi:hypothetical protein
MFHGILAGDAFSFDGARSGGLLRVRLVSGDLRRRGHLVTLLGSEMKKDGLVGPPSLLV